METDIARDGLSKVKKKLFFEEEEEGKHTHMHALYEIIIIIRQNKNGCILK